MMQEAGGRAVEVLSQASSPLRLLFSLGETVPPAGQSGKCNCSFILLSFHKQREREKKAIGFTFIKYAGA